MAMDMSGSITVLYLTLTLSMTSTLKNGCGVKIALLMKGHRRKNEKLKKGDTNE
jgi:hypothetical protein